MLAWQALACRETLRNYAEAPSLGKKFDTIEAIEAAIHSDADRRTAGAYKSAEE